MTVNEAILEMRYSGIPEEDIEAIIEVCKTKGLKPQVIDKELERRGLEKVFELEYDVLSLIILQQLQLWEKNLASKL